MKLAIIVPYRNREENLSEFVPHMMEYLKLFDFKIFLIEQTDIKPFNRGKLLNVGFDIAAKEDFTHFALHDVDMLPLEADYSEVDVPTHLAGQASQFGWHLPYADYFGGVTLFDRKSFEQVNGYHNEYWGWGGEDDDILARCRAEKIEIARKPGKFQSLAHVATGSNHSNHKNNEFLFHEMSKGHIDYKQFGLSDLEYKILKRVDINEKTEKITVEI